MKTLLLTGILFFSFQAFAANTISKMGCVLRNASSVKDSRVTVTASFNQKFDVAGEDLIDKSNRLLANIAIHFHGTPGYGVLRSNVQCTRNVPLRASRLTCTWGKKGVESSFTLTPIFKDGKFAGLMDGDVLDTNIGGYVFDSTELAHVSMNSLVCATK